MSSTTPFNYEELMHSSSEPRLSPSYNELIHALSCVIRNHERAPTQSWVSDPEKKHLNLLDAIALLLVVEDKADVVAVSMIQKLASIEFYYAKNHPCAADITDYIESILEEIRNYQPSQRKRFIRRIVKKASSKCLKKIRNRIRKISIELANAGVKLEAVSNDESIDHIGIWQSTGAPEGAIRDAFETAYQPEYAAQFERPDKKLLAKFFRFSLTMNTSLDKLRSKFGVVMELLKISHYIGRALRKDPIVSSTTLIRRIQKLGDYVGAAKIITKALEAPTVFGLRNAIRFIEVKPPPPVELLIPMDCLSIVNSYADFTKSRRTTWEELAQAYQLERTQPREGNMKVMASVHCECSIAIHMVEKYWEQERHPTFIEIGISKYSCWLCEKYLELLVQDESGCTPDMKIAVSGYQGKIQSGWTIPSNGPFYARCRMGAVLGNEVDAILENVERGYRSDSNPMSDDDDDDINFSGRKDSIECWT